jgi:hypothetical protein
MGKYGLDNPSPLVRPDGSILILGEWCTPPSPLFSLSLSLSLSLIISLTFSLSRFFFYLDEPSFGLTTNLRALLPATCCLLPAAFISYTGRADSFTIGYLTAESWTGPYELHSEIGPAPYHIEDAVLFQVKSRWLLVGCCGLV